MDVYKEKGIILLQSITICDFYNGTGIQILWGFFSERPPKDLPQEFRPPRPKAILPKIIATNAYLQHVAGSAWWFMINIFATLDVIYAGE